MHAQEQKRELKLDTGLATGGFPAPWEVLGSSSPTESGELRFDLIFTFDNRYEGVSVGEASLKFSGVMDFNQEIFVAGELGVEVMVLHPGRLHVPGVEREDVQRGTQAAWRR